MSDALVERLAGVLHTEDVRENPGHADWTTCPTSGPCADLARALLTVVEQEIAAARAEERERIAQAIEAVRSPSLSITENGHLEHAARIARTATSTEEER